MNEYVFEVQLVAAVRVHGVDGNVARKVVSSVLGSPGTEEVRMANENNAALGRPPLPSLNSVHAPVASAYLAYRLHPAVPAHKSPTTARRRRLAGSR